MKQTSAYTYATLLRDLGQYLKPYRWRFVFASTLRLSGDLTYLYTTYALSEIISFFSHYKINASLAPFWFLMLAWASSHAYVTTSRQVAKYFCYRVAERISLDSQLQALRHLNLLDIAWHEKENSGNKLKRLHSGGEGLQKVLRIWIDNLIEAGVNFIGMIAVLAWIDLRVALVMVLFLITYLVLAIPLSRRAAAAARQVNQYEEDFNGLTFEFLNNIRSVKVMGMFKRLFPLLQEQSDRVYQAIIKRIRRFRFKTAAQSNWAHLFRITAFIVIVYGIVQGRYELGFLVLFNFYFTGLRQSAEELSEVSQDLTIARYNIARLRAILDEPVIIADETKKIDFPRQWKKIYLRDVSFAYGDNVVLKNISLEIKRGEKIGVVGLSGAGKSTLFKLLLKEYENFTGEILFDDQPLKQIKTSSYYQKVAVVLQDTEVFNFSLKDNITISNPESAGESARLKTAITISHIDDFLAKLPQGLNTLIGEKGIKLSGGEKQRLGIARAIFREPNILFLDEATSHLDLESEEKIKDSLHRFFQNVTAIVIAHRLTTIQEMDRIILIEDGQLLESGSFETLMKQRGRFFELWEKQKF